MTSISKQINFITLHGDRLICDDWVYLRKNGEFEVIQNLERHKNVSTGAALTRDLLALGHSAYSRVSLWKWHETEYIMITSMTIFGRVGGTHVTAELKLMKRDPFSEEVNEIYVVMYGSELYKFKVFMKQLEADKQESFSKKNMINRFDKTD